MIFRVILFLGMVLLVLVPGPLWGRGADFDGDGVVTFGDFALFAGAFGTDSPVYDLDGDGRVAFGDFVMFVRVLGQRDGFAVGEPGLRGLRKAPGKQGVADLFIRRRGTGSTGPLVQVGDVLEVEAFVESNGAAVTQVTLFVSFDDTYLEIIPAIQQGEVVRPFSQGEWLAGQMFFNDTLDDVIGNSDINEIPGFQLRYSELIPRFFGTPQRVAVGNGVVARFQLRVIRRPPGGTTSVRVDVVSPTGSETGYFIDGDPGSVYNFRTITPMTVTVGEEPPTAISKHQAVVLATVTQDGVPAAGLEVAFSRSISGRPSDYRWKGVTDPNGRVKVEIVADVKVRRAGVGPDGEGESERHSVVPQFWRVGASGYYLVRAVDPVSGEVVGRWGSVPITGGKEVDLLLPIGGRVQSMD